MVFQSFNWWLFRLARVTGGENEYHAKLDVYVCWTDLEFTDCYYFSNTKLHVSDYYYDLEVKLIHQIIIGFELIQSMSLCQEIIFDI